MAPWCPAWYAICCSPAQVWSSEPLSAGLTPEKPLQVYDQYTSNKCVQREITFLSNLEKDFSQRLPRKCTVLVPRMGLCGW